MTEMIRELGVAYMPESTVSSAEWLQRGLDLNCHGGEVSGGEADGDQQTLKSNQLYIPSLRILR